MIGIIKAEKGDYMQVNRLSVGLQEELKTATNFNTARNEALFDKEQAASKNGEEVDFSSLDLDDLNITQDQIGGLLDRFADEIINVFSGKMSGLPVQNPENPANQQQNNPVFIA